MKQLSVLASVACLMVAAVVMAADEKPKKKGVQLKCPVSGGAAKMTSAADYKGAKVYLCCDKCPVEFGKNTAKYATMANHQLVQSKQFRQAACPLSGGKIDKSKSVKVGGVNVAFCCGKCQGKVAGAEGESQIALVFADGAFDKGFKVKKAKK